jgi:hypothetical protein
VPLAAFFVLFSAGAAAAPECHIETTAQTINTPAVAHNHSASAHSHSHQSTNVAVSNVQETLVTAGSSLNNEICFIVGFIVLLLLRFSHFTRSIFSASRIPRPRYLQPSSLSKNLGYLNLTHLQLGIIRI